jgi:uncharacterized repeat protein (TIGR01451 family)
MKKYLIQILISVLCLQTTAFAQIIGLPGQDGVGGVLSGVVNTYYAGLGSAPAGSSSIAIGTRDPNGAAAPIRAGNMLLVIQMQDAILDSSDSDLYGDGIAGNPASGSSGGSAGLYEFVIAASDATLGTVSIQGLGAGNGLINSYSSSNPSPTEGQKRFQVIRVPQLSSAILSSSLTAAPWNGSTGGVLALDIAGTATMSGTVDVSGKGFRGAGGRLLNGAVGATGEAIEYRVPPATGTDNDGGKGEGIAGTPRYVLQNGNLLDLGIEGYPNGSAGFGAPGNAGGGGTNATGGGGGANGGRGGRGGDNWSPTETTVSQRHLEPLGGFGGSSSNATSSRLYLGGGGGAGANRNLQGAHGGAGGGIVLIRAGRFAGSGTIRADGEAGTSLFLTGSAGNVGGGGAGGSVLLTSTVGNLNAVAVTTRGGAGASVGGGTTIHAAGGGGGGGLVFLSSITNVFSDGGARGSSPAEFDTNNGGTGEILSTHLPERGLDGVLPVIGVDPVRDVPGVPGGASVVPVLSVSMTAAPNVALAGDVVMYSLSVQNELGRAAASGLALASDGLPTGFSLLGVERVEFTGGATGPVAPVISGSTNAPIFGVAAGSITSSYFVPAGGKVTLVMRVQIAASVPNGIRQHPGSVTYLDPARSAPEGTAVVRYNSASSSADDVDVTAVDVPVANNDTASTSTNTAVTIDVIQNDSNPAGGVLQIDLDPTTSRFEDRFEVLNGVFTLENLLVVFTPNPLVSGTAQLEYTIVNRLGVVSNRAVVVVSISSTIPITRDDLASTTDVTPVRINVLSNDNNPSGGALQIDLDPDTVGLQSKFERTGQGVFELSGAEVLFTPIRLFDGTVLTEYTVTNDLGFTSARAKISILVRRVTTNVSGMVFDDSNNDGQRQATEVGIANVRIIITDANSSQEVTTSAAGTYRIEVTSGLVQARVITPTERIASTSLSQSVTVLPGSSVEFSPVGFSTAQLAATLSISSPRALVGQAVRFSIVLKNNSGFVARNGVVILRLPNGFRVIEANLPFVNQPSNEIRFNNLQIGARQQRIISGVLMVMPTRASGEASFTAEANATFGTQTTPTVIQANPSQANIQIIENNVGSLVGLVFQDKDQNSVFSSGDQVLPNVPVLLSNGWIAKTDTQGRYSFLGLPIGKYWVRLDSDLTIKTPDGLQAQVIDIQTNTISQLNFAVTSISSVQMPFGLGSGGLQIGYGSQGFSASLSLQGVTRLTFGEWRVFGILDLNLNVNKNGFGAVSSARQAPAFGLLGADGSSRQGLGQSDDGIFLRIEAPMTQIEYGRGVSTVSSLLISNQSLQGLRFNYSELSFKVQGFASLVSTTRTTQSPATPYGIAGDGSRIYQLSSDWLPLLEGSERLIIATRDRLNLNLKIKPDRLLQRGQDYTLDVQTGKITLFEPLYSTDVSGNMIFLEVTVASTSGNFSLNSAIQGQYQYNEFTFGAVLGWQRNTPLLMLQAQTNWNGLSAQGELGWSGDFIGAAQITYRFNQFQITANYRHLGLRTVGVSAEVPAFNLGIAGQYDFGSPIPEIDNLLIRASVSNRTPYSPLETSNTTLQTTAQARFGSSTALLGYYGRWTDTLLNPGSFVQAGYAFEQIDFAIQLAQRIPITLGTFGETEFSARLAIDPNTTLNARVQFVFAPDVIRTEAWIGISGKLAESQYRFGLALPNLNEKDSAAVLTLNTTLPLTPTVSLSAGAEFRWVEQPLFTLQSGILFNQETIRASATLDLNLQSTGISFNSSLNATVQPTDDSVIAPSIRWLGSNNTLSYNLQGAYRTFDLSLLSQHQGQMDPISSSLTGDLRASYGLEDKFSVRFGLAYQIEAGYLTLTTSIGFSTLLENLRLSTPEINIMGLRLGGQLLWQWQPATSSHKLGFGVEASLPIDRGLYFTVGINILGFSDNTGFQANPGIYVRLDYSFEQFLRLIFPR